MTQKIPFLFLLTLLFQSVNAQLADSLVKRIDSVFAEYSKTNSPGCALSILKDGQIIYEKGYGMSNLEYNIPITPSSIFHVASVSKQFTAAAIVKLSLEGKLSLNDDIRKYIPEVPDFGHTITFNHLLHHTSGIRDQWELQVMAGWREDDLITEVDIMEMLARQKALNFVPGDEYAYCNTGYTLLAIAVKKITGVSLRTYADSIFFKPLGMTHTHFHSDHAEITPNRTSAYEKDEEGTWKISIPVFDTYGATSLFTTVEDLAKWDENFYTEKIGGKDFVNAMQRTGVLNDKTTQNYACGLAIQTYKGYKTVEHGGADAGYRSMMLRLPDQHFSVILLANLANINSRATSYKVVNLFLKDNTVTAPATNIITDSTIVKGWAGEYYDKRTKAIQKFAWKDNKLLVNKSVLRPSNSSFFTNPNSGSTFSFSGDSLHAKLTLLANGMAKQTFEKAYITTLTTAQLQEYTGEFYSPELDTKYILTANDSALLVKVPKNDEMTYTSYIKDVFIGNYNLTFNRDKSNKITGFFLSNGRVRNLYFEKLRTE